MTMTIAHHKSCMATTTTIPPNPCHNNVTTMRQDGHDDKGWNVVFKSLVQTITGPVFSQNIKRPDQTEKYCQKIVFAVLKPVLVFRGLDWFFKILFSNFIVLLIRFNMNPRTLTYVKYWCSYENNRVHVLFFW